MSLYVPSNSFGTRQVTWLNSGAFDTSFGNSTTPGTSDSEGSWDQLLSSVTDPASVFALAVQTTYTSGVSKSAVMDVGFGGAGSEVEKIANLIVGSLLTQGRIYWFPLYIPSGTRIAVRGTHSYTTAGTFNNGCAVFGKAKHPELFRVGQGVETVGAFTGSVGVSITSGDSGTFGAWTSVGTTTHACFHWNFGVQIANATVTNRMYEFQFGYGDATAPTEIARIFLEATGVESLSWGYGRTLASFDTPFSNYADVPAGATIYCRAVCNGVADTGFSVAAYGTY